MLRINGFDSFLALKGFRYDEKEFFASLEKTVKDFLDSDFENKEKLELTAALAAQYQSASNFCVKPGHRSYIMNLMLEIEKTEISEFFQKTAEEDKVSALQQISLIDEESLMLNSIEVPSEERPIIISRVEHGYSRDNEEQEVEVEEYEYEEYLSNDESSDHIGMIRIDYDSAASTSTTKPKQESRPGRTAKRRPQHMYNEEFMAKSVNPRRRRITSNKTYPNTDEGTRERFRDLLFQVSLESTSKSTLNNYLKYFRAWNASCRAKGCPQLRQTRFRWKSRKSRTRPGLPIAQFVVIESDCQSFTRMADATATTNDQTLRDTCDLSIAKTSEKTLEQGMTDE